MKRDQNQNVKLTQRHVSPWAWIPTLYIAEGLPLVLIVTVSTIMYTQLGASLSAIGFWTSLLGFAWTIKPLWGPLVELYWTKRRWSVLMQIFMGVLLGIVALTLQTDWWWSGSLFSLAIVALFSATHDIAADGFYMDALDEKQQAFFVGIRSTFYRIAMIFGQGVLLIIAGFIEQNTGPKPSELLVYARPVAADVSSVSAPAGDEGFVKFNPRAVEVNAGTTVSVAVSLNQQPDTTRTVTLRRVPSSIFGEFFPIGAEQAVALADKKYEVLRFDSTNWNQPQQIVLTVEDSLSETISVPFKAASGNLPLTWALCFGGVGLIMLSFGVYHTLALPKPLMDGSSVEPSTPFINALGVMALVVAVPVAIYAASFYSLYAVLEGVAHAIWGDELPFSATIIKFATIAAVVALGWAIFQLRTIRNSSKRAFQSAARVSQVPFDEVFASFFSKPGIARMVAFLLVYRLGEGLLVKMSGPFLIKPVAEGGMGLSSSEYGFAYGSLGVLTMIVGGILGGIVASRYGLKRWILPMCVAINVPDLFYVYLAYAQPTDILVIYGAVVTETFGYGFGFTGYMLYMLYIAGTGEHKTSHFALCTGFMSLGMLIPGMISGDIAESLTTSALGPQMGWTWFFVIVCLATIPGFLMLAFIPLDKEFGRRSTNDPEIVEQD